MVESAFYFAVFEGRVPSVNTVWTEFEAQVKDFDRYKYDIYLTEAAARRALNKFCLQHGRHHLMVEDECRYFVVYKGWRLRCI